MQMATILATEIVSYTQHTEETRMSQAHKVM